MAYAICFMWSYKVFGYAKAKGPMKSRNCRMGKRDPSNAEDVMIQGRKGHNIRPEKGREPDNEGQVHH